MGRRPMLPPEYQAALAKSNEAWRLRAWVEHGVIERLRKGDARWRELYRAFDAERRREYGTAAMNERFAELKAYEEERMLAEPAVVAARAAQDEARAEFDAVKGRLGVLA